MPCPRCDPRHAEGIPPNPHRAHRSWALVGTPNVGKTSLINAIAGSRLSIGNWSGTTVDLARADTLVEGAPLTLVDLPGTYALAGTSAEEDSVLPALLANPAALIVNVVDAQHLARDLTLTLELSELERPLVVVLNLLELAAARGIELDPAPLGARRDPSERVDRVILHPVLGPLALIAGLALTFHLTFALSTPWIDFLGVVQGVLAGWVAAPPSRRSSRASSRGR